MSLYMWSIIMCFNSYSPYEFSFVCAKTAVTKSRQEESVYFFLTPPLALPKLGADD